MTRKIVFFVQVLILVALVGAAAYRTGYDDGYSQSELENNFLEREGIYAEPNRYIPYDEPQSD